MHKIESAKLLKDVMTNYFVGLGDTSKKIAWCTSVGPAELLRSFGFEVYFPENHGALLGTTRTSGDFIPVASKLGYSSDICSYLTSDIGSYLSKDTPLMKHYGLSGVPKPDVLVYSTNQCREVQDWLTYFAKEFNTPIVGVQSPRHLDEVKKEDIDN
ncbi:MAG: 2-hydroxyacyl-CoA dehydratase family protein, partial [Bacteroidetes bacterium]|nr:2-hydroxyacyl-CoA dehydratase family protein [Bacteroidota bacterium]